MRQILRLGESAGETRVRRRTRGPLSRGPGPPRLASAVSEADCEELIIFR